MKNRMLTKNMKWHKVWKKRIASKLPTMAGTTFPGGNGVFPRSQSRFGLKSSVLIEQEKEYGL
jgi:hypothetical protein